MRIAPASVSPTHSDESDSIPPVVAVPSAFDNGERRTIDGAEFIFFHGYWVRYYKPLEESLASRKLLIDHLTKRAFHHTEPGINTPGERLDTARDHYHQQTDPAMKRVNAAMLAGALFNRATDIFTAIVELDGDYFKEALELGKEVKHFSGEEGIDELWGEPFRAFTVPITAYYESRFIKVAQAKANIDRVTTQMKQLFCERAEFVMIGPLLDDYATAAKHECETMKSDVCIFDIWPRFIATGEALGNAKPVLQPGCTQECHYLMDEAQHTLIAGRNLINWVARARVPMPRSTDKYFARCSALAQRMKDSHV